MSMPAAQATDLQAVPSSHPPVPPAIYYGPILAGNGFVPSEEMTVTARIGVVQCGQGLTTEDGGQVVYNIDVVDESITPGCGAAGSTIVFYVDGQQMTPTAIWDNEQAHELPLSPFVPTHTPTPTATFTATPTPTVTTTVTPTSTATGTPTPTVTSTMTSTATKAPTRMPGEPNIYLPLVMR
jgi:hypothetical protein